MYERTEFYEKVKENMSVRKQGGQGPEAKAGQNAEYCGQDGRQQHPADTAGLFPDRQERSGTRPVENRE